MHSERYALSEHPLSLIGIPVILPIIQFAITDGTFRLISLSCRSCRHPTAMSQHSGSIAHTASQQASISQPGVLLGSQQLPSPSVVTVSQLPGAPAGSQEYVSQKVFSGVQSVVMSVTASQLPGVPAG